MKRWYLNILFLFISLPLSAQYISEVLEYTPAPGQFINDATWGSPTTSTHSIIGKTTGKLNLGAFGGYVVFKFENPVENDPNNPFGVDFTIFGNPITSPTGTWSEPAVVYVMQDQNGNGLPDDVWYELAGSDYHFSSTIKNYQVTYYNPNSNVAADVFWTDNMNYSGYILANTYHEQPYYPLPDSFPHINQTAYTLTGTLLENLVDLSDPAMVTFPQRSFGYVDNQFRGPAPFTVPDNPYTREKENSGGDAFDISWAVDEAGNYVDLESIDFVKVQGAILADAGWLGEVSSEITGAVDVEPNPAITGVMDMIVIRDLPKVIQIHEQYQMEVFVFHQGRPINADVQWESSLNGVSVDENNVLTFTEVGDLELTCSLVSNPEIKCTVKTTISYSFGVEDFSASINLFPNPNRGVFTLTMKTEKAEVSIFNMLGQKVLSIDNASNHQVIDCSSLPNGSYLVKIATQEMTPIFKKFIKQ